jgi:hypothetical protein
VIFGIPETVALEVTAVHQEDVYELAPSDRESGNLFLLFQLLDV